MILITMTIIPILNDDTNEKNNNEGNVNNNEDDSDNNNNNTEHEDVQVHFFGFRHIDTFTFRSNKKLN